MKMLKKTILKKVDPQNIIFLFCLLFKKLICVEGNGTERVLERKTQNIKNNPTLLQKTMSALKAGGTAALEQALNHPAASFVINALDDLNKNNK